MTMYFILQQNLVYYLTPYSPDFLEGGQSNEEDIESAASSSESDDDDDTYLFVPMTTLVKKIKDQGIDLTISFFSRTLFYDPHFMTVKCTTEIKV